MKNDVMKELRKRVLTVSHYGKDGNLQSVFSALDLIWVLYDKILNCTNKNCLDNDRDFFILSKGQATLGLYAVLEKKGFFKKGEIESFCKIDSRFGMQADRTKFQGGIEISAGSLGHGMPMAVGVALASKISHSPSQVYTLVGDGEFNEGNMWEAALLAGAKKLNNFCVVIDDNDSIGTMLDMGNMEQKLTAFGFKVVTINGHDHNQIEKAYRTSHKNEPLAIIAKTKRGYGSNTMMTNSKWFHRAPNNKELLDLLKEVDNFEICDV